MEGRRKGFPSNIVRVEPGKGVIEENALMSEQALANNISGQAIRVILADAG
jgi:hypothetical protein